MHLTTPSHGFRRTGWKKFIIDLNQIILQNVGKGWFSYAEYCDGNWPFWSYHAEHVHVVLARWVGLCYYDVHDEFRFYLPDECVFLTVNCRFQLSRVM